MPLTVASGVDMPRSASPRRSARRCRTARSPFADLAMVRHFEERFFGFEEIARSRPRRSSTARRRSRRCTRSPGHARPLDVLRRPRHDRRERRRGRAPRPDELTCVDHVRASDRLGAGLRRRGRGGPRPTPTSSCSAASRRRSWTPPAPRPAARPVAGVDRIYAADHQVPTADGPQPPARGPRADRRGAARAGRGPRRRSSPRPPRRSPADNVVIAHLFSVLPKLGLAEDDVPPRAARRARGRRRADRARDRGRRALALPVGADAAPVPRRGVPLLLSTDSHRRETIGRFAYCLDRPRARGHG